jgi:hypothetical protein
MVKIFRSNKSQGGNKETGSKERKRANKGADDEG